MEEYCAYSSTQMMETAHFSEMSVNIHQATWHDIPEDSNLHRYCPENLRSHSVIIMHKILIHLGKPQQNQQSFK
jgi:hypothetical protein